jgi:MFS transporter, MCT family, solute carrier family 16 (monocarboxylic acid transporters), member 10
MVEYRLLTIRVRLLINRSSGASVFGRISIGALSDKVDTWILALVSLSLTSLFTFILWGVLAHSLAGLLVFSLAYGTIAGGWTSTWSGFIKPLCREFTLSLVKNIADLSTGDDPTLHTSIFGFLLLTRGLGNILSTPIATSMYNGPKSSSAAHGRTGYAVGGGRFEEMIVYVGTCFACAAMAASVGWLSEKYHSRR